MRRLVLVGFSALSACVLAFGTALAQPAPPEAPGLPDLAPVAVDPSTSALLLLDLTSVICPPRPACMASLAPVGRLLARARAAGVLVGYSISASGDIMPDIAPRAGDPMVASHADKFFNTNLDDILQSHGVQTVVLVGAAANGAVLYTSFGAVERGYTVVVPVDGISSGPEFDTYLAEYQMLNMPGYSNPSNQPLNPDNATLSRTDLITFAAAAK